MKLRSWLWARRVDTTHHFTPYLELKGEGAEVTMSQPSQEPPTAPNSVESTESGSTSVQETLTTEGGDGNFGPGEDVQVHHEWAPLLPK